GGRRLQRLAATGRAARGGQSGARRARCRASRGTRLADPPSRLGRNPMTTSDSPARGLPKSEAPPDGDEKGWLNRRTVAYFLGLLALNYILASAFVNGAS